MARSRASTRRVPVKKDAELTGDLVLRAEKGDQRALATVRVIFDESPGYWEAFGNLTTMAENVLVKAVAGDAALFQEAIRRQVETLKADLAGPTPSPLERLLIKRVAVCWLQMHDADARDARRASQLDVARGDYDQRRQDRAHKRYLSAIRTLLQIQRLPITSVQVNIGAQQVNALQVSAERKADP